VIYLLDADTLNYVVKGIEPAKARFRQAVAAGASFILSLVVHHQVTRYLKLKGAARVQRFYEDLTSDWLRVGLDDADWDTASDLWERRHRAGRPIQDADLLIAVIALKTGATLVTNNSRHFEGLGVAVENWMAAPNE
jgi:predicted nucleic acid-binding protein